MVTEGPELGENGGAGLPWGDPANVEIGIVGVNGVRVTVNLNFRVGIVFEGNRLAGLDGG